MKLEELDIGKLVELAAVKGYSPSEVAVVRFTGVVTFDRTKKPVDLPPTREAVERRLELFGKSKSVFPLKADYWKSLEALRQGEDPWYSSEAGEIEGDDLEYLGLDKLTSPTIRIYSDDLYCPQK